MIWQEIVLAEHQVTKKPSSFSTTVYLEQEIPGIFPVRAVTRATADKVLERRLAEILRMTLAVKHIYGSFSF